MGNLRRRLALLIVWMIACAATTLPACGSMGGMRGMFDEPVAATAGSA